MGVLLFLLSIAIIVLIYFIAKVFQEIAADKGYNDTKYFWWTFWVTPVGISMVLALPDKKAAAQRDKMISLLESIQDPEIEEKRQIENALKF